MNRTDKRVSRPAAFFWIAVALGAAAASCAADRREPDNPSGTPGGPGASSEEAPALPVDEVPRLVSSTPPAYPEEARARGVEGTVYVRARLGKDGAVAQAAADPARPSSPLLEKAAIDAVSRWTFAPAKSRGEPVETWIVVPVRFQLDGDSSKPQ